MGSDTILSKWLFGFVFLSALMLPREVQAEESSSLKLAHGPVVRASVDTMRLVWLRDHRSEVEQPGVSTAMDLHNMERGDALGGTLRLGYAAESNRDLGVQGFFEGSYARASAKIFDSTIAGVEQSYRSEPRYWAALIGAEMQVLRRILAVGVGAGLGGIIDRPVAIEPEGLNVEGRSKWGLLGRVSMAVHVPGLWGAHVGVGCFADGFFAPKIPLLYGPFTRGARVGLLAFVEWDGSRR